MILMHDNVLKKYDDYFIIVMMMSKLRIWFIYKIGMSNFGKRMRIMYSFRTTEQLSYIHNQMSRDSKSRQALSKELETIFRT